MSTETLTEDQIIDALVEVAARTAGVAERAAFWVGGWEDRSHDVDEADRIAREHGFDECRLSAMRSLARSRDVELAVVLRAALSGDLRDVVRLPPARDYARQE